MSCHAIGVLSEFVSDRFSIQTSMSDSGQLITVGELSTFGLMVLFQVVAWHLAAAVVRADVCMHRNRQFALSFLTSLINGFVATAVGLLVFTCAFEQQWMPEGASTLEEMARGLFQNYLLTSTPLSRFVSLWFLSHCLVDMGLALVYYKEEMKLDTGWVHHVFYSFLQVYVLSTNWGTSFALHLASESPTWVLAVGAVHEPFAMQDLFGLLFIVFRCLMHVVPTVLYLYYLPGVPLPWVLQIFTLYMHVNFTQHWIRHRLGLRQDPAYVFPEPDERWRQLRAQGKVPPLPGVPDLTPPGPDGEAVSKPAKASSPRGPVAAAKSPAPSESEAGQKRASERRRRPRPRSAASKKKR